MCSLTLALVKNLLINLGQLRIKPQIDSQLCDSIFAAYVRYRPVFKLMSMTFKANVYDRFHFLL